MAAEHKRQKSVWVKADVKAIIDRIVDELAKDERIDKLYRVLFRQLGNLFREDYRRSASAHHIDRKRRRKLQEKKQAQGHARDDHAPQLHL